MDSFTWPPDKPLTEEDKAEASLDRFEEDHSFAEHEEDYAAASLPDPKTPFEKKLLDRAKTAAAECNLLPFSPVYADAVMEFVEHALRIVPAPRDEDGDWAMRYRVGINKMRNFLRDRRRPVDQLGHGAVSVSRLTEAASRSVGKDDDNGVRYDYDFVEDTKFMPPDLAAMLSEFQERAERALDDLPLRQRQVFQWVVVEEQPGKAVAERLMVDPTTVTRDKRDALEFLESRLRVFVNDGTVEDLLQWMGRGAGSSADFTSSLCLLMKGKP